MSRRVPVLLLVPAFLGLSGAAASSAAAPATHSLIQVGEDLPVAIGATGLAAVEPYLAADPRDASHLVAGVILVANLGDPRQEASPKDESLTCAALASFDAGRTWMRHDFPVKECLDPWVAVLADGSALFLALGPELLAFRSPDGGRTWNEPPVSLGRRHDHGTLTVDRTEGPFAGSVYVASHQGQPGKPLRDAAFIARSADKGTSFHAPAKIVSSNLSAFAMNPAVLSDGTLVVPIVNFARTTANGEHDLFDRAPSWVITSADGGKTFSIPLFVTDVCARGFPELAADASGGPYRDRLYWICRDRDHEHIYLTSSSDHGESWTEPTVVNQGSGRSPSAQNAVIAVNREGVLGISWYDARNDPRGYREIFRCQEVFFTASLDGGRTFLPEVKVSTGENCPDTPANGEAGRRWLEGGEYHGLTATADGRFQVLWADSREGIYQLRTATIQVDGKAIGR